MHCSLTAEERQRNVPGDMLVFEYAAGSKESEHCDTTMPRHFSTIVHANSLCRHVPPPEPIPVQDRGFVPQLAKGTLTGKKNPPGFPTLKTMSVSGLCSKCPVHETLVGKASSSTGWL